MKLPGMKENPKRGITVTSSLMELPMNQLGIERWLGGKTYSTRPFLQQASGQIFKDDVKDFSPPLIFSSCCMDTNGQSGSWFTR